MGKAKGCLTVVGGLALLGGIGLVFNSGGAPSPDSAPIASSRPLPRVGGYVLPRAGSFRCTDADAHKRLMGLYGAGDREAIARFIREQQSCEVMLDPQPMRVVGASGLDYLRVTPIGDYREYVVLREQADVVTLERDSSP